MSERRPGRTGAVTAWLFGAAGPAEPRTMAEALGLAEEAPRLQRLRDAEPQRRPEEPVLMDSMVCFAGGAMGAVFSVIIRLRDAYQLIRPAPGRTGSADVPADPVQLARTMRQEGWYRVVVGWFPATSLFLLISGGILTLLTPPAAPADLCGPGPLSPAGRQALIKAWFFRGSVGFLAGLNERWAYGLVSRGGEPRPGGPAAG
ncbi:hypothetical protein [Streptomyces sp. NPDC086989]|uniref:hypothetical protein n=1 Tax=Streptomyces sp. NPDC086989 TaxID=3365764 RepID=UPI0038252ADB